MKPSSPSERSVHRHELTSPRHSQGLAQPMPPSSRARPTLPAEQNEGITPAFAYRVFCQWWKWIVPAGLLLSVTAGALVMHFHIPKYEARALIMIDSSTPYIAFSKDASTRGAARYVETQIEMLRGVVVLGPVIGRPEIASLEEFRRKLDPLEYLQKQLTIKQVGKSELYDIRYMSASATAAASVANAIVAEYLSMQSDENFRRSQRVIDVLEEERLRRSLEVERLRKRVVELAKEITGKDPFGQGAVTNIDMALSPVAALYQNISEVDVNREVLKAEIQALRESPMLIPDHAASSGLLDVEIANRADVRELEANIDAIRDRMEYIQDISRKWETHTEYVRLKQDSDDLTTELAELKTTLHEELLKQRMEDRKAQHGLLIATKEQELKILNARKSLWSAKFDEHLEELKAGGAQSVQMEFARAELVREEKVFELIAARKLALQTELRAPARVALKQSARVPYVAQEPIPYKLLMVACVVSLVCPMGLVLVREMTVQRIVNTEQLMKESQLRVLGEVARFPVRPVAKGPLTLPNRLKREMFIFAESIDSLRTHLMLTEDVGGADQHKIIAIASASSGEGKTSVATSLAVSVAGATKQPTLVIDADLRSPDVAEVLGVPSSPGLAEVLIGKSSLNEAIHRIENTNTYVLPAGRTKVNPHHVTQGLQVNRLLESLRSKFPTIIIDTPPILSASESLVYAKAADFVVYCSLNDVSRARQVRIAVERLQTTGANVAGAVLSGMPANRYAYYGYYADHAT